VAAEAAFASAANSGLRHARGFGSLAKMADSTPAAWARPYFRATTQRTRIFFVCFGKAPLADLPIESARFGLPSRELAALVDVREHRRADKRQWFEDWWGDAFGVIASQDLEAELPLLTTSDTCFTLQLDLPDQGDLSALQTVWGLTRWLCARGADVVLDVHAFRYRSRRNVEGLAFEQPDVQREVKLVLETDADDRGLYLLHTRGLCKFARPELISWVWPDDAAVIGTAVNQIARTLMEGASSEQIRLRLTQELELVTQATSERALVDSLGLQAAVELVRSDGAPLAGVTRLVGG
jgi:hypothetical protein